MPTCQICRHIDREAIDVALQSDGVNKSHLAEEYGVTRYSLINHSQRHMGQRMQDSVGQVPTVQRPKSNAVLLETARRLHAEAVLCPGQPPITRLLREITALLVEMNPDA